MFVTVFAFFAIVFTGRYPRRIFDFVVGVFRWSWRVRFYTLTVFGTDRYPPFSLKPRDDYPADLHIDYPQRLSQWMPLVKWFLAIPHFLVLGALMGFSVSSDGKVGQSIFRDQFSIVELRADVMESESVYSLQTLLPTEFRDYPYVNEIEEGSHSFPGLLQVLILIALIALLFTGKYHKDIFRLVMGINRWNYRVSAYVTLLTDRYPHFRLMD